MSAKAQPSSQTFNRRKTVIPAKIQDSWLQVTGVPGSGKTTAVLKRVRQYLSAGFAAERLCLLSLSTTSVAVLRSRLQDSELQSVQIYSGLTFSEYSAQVGDVLIIDDFHDATRAQAKAVGALTGKLAGLTVIGNRAKKAQSHADLAFAGHSGDRRVTFVNRSWRLTEQNAALVSTVLQCGARKNLGTLTGKRIGARPQLHTAESVLAQVDALVRVLRAEHESGVAYSDIAVIAKTHATSSMLRAALASALVPAQGPYLRDLKRVLWLAKEFEQGRFAEKSISLGTAAEIISKKLGFEAVSASALVKKMRKIRSHSFLGLFAQCIDIYLSALRGTLEDPKLRKRIRNFLHAYEPLASDFENATGMFNAMTRNALSDTGVQILTPRMALGSEWSTVLVFGMTDGIWPHYKADQEKVAEEATLLGYTLARARDSIHLFHSPTMITRHTRSRSPSPYLRSALVRLQLDVRRT